VHTSRRPTNKAILRVGQQKQKCRGARTAGHKTQKAAESGPKNSPTAPEKQSLAAADSLKTRGPLRDSNHQVISH